MNHLDEGEFEERKDLAAVYEEIEEKSDSNKLMKIRNPTMVRLEP